jgi:hypothetical protein
VEPLEIVATTYLAGMEQLVWLGMFQVTLGRILQNLQPMIMEKVEQEKIIQMQLIQQEMQEEQDL